MRNTINDCYYKRKSGRWVGQIDFGRDPQTGQLDRDYVYGASKGEAKKKVQQILKKIHTGQFIKSDNIKLKNWLPSWLEGRKNVLEYKSFKGYQSIIDNHIIPEIGEYNLKDINTRVIQKLINDKYKNGRIRGSGGLSRRTVEYIT